MERDKRGHHHPGVPEYKKQPENKSHNTNIDLYAGPDLCIVSGICFRKAYFPDKNQHKGQAHRLEQTADFEGKPVAEVFGGEPTEERSK